MENAQHPFFYGLLMLIAGLGIPIFAALNGELGSKLQNPALAATISLTVGVIASLIFLLSFGSILELKFVSNAPIHSYFGGLFVIFYILSITWVAPRFGVGNAVAFVLLGQLLSMSIIDHYGMLGAMVNEISLKRIIGLSLMAVGVFLTVRS